MITLTVTLDLGDPSELTHMINGRGWMKRGQFIEELDRAIAHVEELAKFGGRDMIQIVIKVAEEVVNR